MRKLLYTLTLTALLVVGQLEAQISSPTKVTVQDEGVSAGIVGQLNCVGTSITCAVSGDVATVTIAAGGSVTSTAIVVNFDACNFGPTGGSYSCTVTVTDAAVTTSSKIFALYQGGGPGRPSGEAEMTTLTCNALPSTGTFLLTCYSVQGPASGTYIVNYIVG